MHYIGMDCHITTLDFAVVNEAGRLVKANSVATSVNGFMEFVKTVPPPRTIYMEEGTLAAWVLETCTGNPAFFCLVVSFSNFVTLYEHYCTAA